MIPSTTLILIVIIVFIGALIRSSIGFGEAVVGMPLLAFIIDIKSATPIMALTASTLALLLIITSWKKVSLKDAWPFVISTLFGLPLGLYYLKNTSDDAIKFILGILLILFGIYYLANDNLPYLKTERMSVPFGFLAGILGGAYNTNGPPTVIYGVLRRWPPEKFRATLQGIFFPTGLIITLSHGLTGLWTDFVLNSFLVSFPFILLAFYLGNKLHHRINENRFKRIIYIFILIIGAVLIINSIL
ncbi:MAG TPA: sulfite exporter TauE/SafE family protein [Melioribacteraceae bacterium]|nr:sulfite exporter TauE/SafE family protein [Melioribacteraceae bacterium]